MNSSTNLGKKPCRLNKKQYDMSMSLTPEDLQAVKELVDSSIDERVQPMLDTLENHMFKRMKRLETKLTEKIDQLSKDTADGFAEVHEKINGVLSVVN